MKIFLATNYFNRESCVKKVFMLLSFTICVSNPAFAVITTEKLNSTEPIATICKVTFNFGKNTFDRDTVSRCLEKIPNKSEVNNIDILASASPGGSTQYNKDLTDKRVQVIKSLMNEEFPGVAMKSISLGINKKYGRTGLIRFVSVPKETIQPEVEIAPKDEVKQQEPEEQKNEQIVSTTEVIPESVQSKDPNEFNTHFSLRLGRDIYMKNIQAPYLATGGEVGIEFQKKDWLRYEFAIQGNTLTNVTNDNVLNLYTFYAMPGIYYTNSGFIVGVRGLLGGISNEKGSTARDFGGELRAGYEFKTFSIIFDAGRTEDTVRMGVSLGVKI